VNKAISSGLRSRLRFEAGDGRLASKWLPQFEQWVIRRFDPVDARDRVEDDPTMSFVLVDVRGQFDCAELNQRTPRTPK